VNGPALRARGLTKSYGKTPVLRGLNMNVPAGSVYGFLGVNGAGKTTTFGVLAGIIARHGGEFEFGGRLGLLPQDASLYPDRRLFRQLFFLGRLEGLDRGRACAAAESCLAAVGLADRARHKPPKLSHGMRRRLALAQALLGDPDVLLLDEPTAGLDPDQSARLRSLVAGWGGRKTVVVSSHLLSEVEQMCDQVGVIHGGKMIYEGPVEGLTGARDTVVYRFDRSPPPRLLEGLPGVREVRADGEEMTVRFEPGVCSLEDLNRRVLELCFTAGAGVREIVRGRGLEAGFLELLR